MNKNEKKLVTDIQRILNFRGISLYESSFVRPNKIDTAEQIELNQQSKHGVSASIEEYEDEGQPFRIFESIVTLGIRAVDATTIEDNSEEPKVFFQIEAQYLVEYEILPSEEADEEALKAFSRFNVVHNVWPFWRQHVTDICQKANLPQFDIPLFPGVES